jgi:hypothetical protein
MQIPKSESKNFSILCTFHLEQLLEYGDRSSGGASGSRSGGSSGYSSRY